MHARLPQAALETNTLGHMKPGQRGYTLPWGMSVDEHGYLWLSSMYPLEETAHGTASMEVYRDHDGDYHVRIPAGETYTPGTRSHTHWFAIPVAGLL